MNGNKGSHFSAEEQAVATVAKALGQPDCIAIVRLLATRTSCTTGSWWPNCPCPKAPFRNA